jgi:TolB-like protein
VKDFLARLNRHHIARVAAAYFVGAWFMIQLVNNLHEMVKWPDSISQGILLLIVVGFPISVLLAWAFQPAGANRSVNTPLDLAFAAALFMVTASILWGQFVPGLMPPQFQRIVGDEFRFASAYIVLGWIVIESARIATANLKVGRVVTRASAIAMLAGFPVSMALAWFFDVQIPPDQYGTLPLEITNFSFVGALIAIGATTAYRRTKDAKPAERSENIEPISVVKVSVAVLPFVNLSGDSAQDFFSDGMTVEITMALASLPDLLVIGRASAFEFKGRNDWRVIGEQLATSHLLLGTVQKSGSKVRITAELFRAADSFPQWRGQFDREIVDIFAIQEDIGKAIAAALHIPLGLKGSAPLVRNRTRNLPSYENHLRAKVLIRSRGLANLTKAAALLEMSVAADPDYAPAWSMLAYAYALTPGYDLNWHAGNVEAMRAVVVASLPRAESAACHALELDPQDVYAQLSLAIVKSARGQFVEGESHYKAALKLDPDNPDVLHGYSVQLADVGHLKQAMVVRRQLEELEPFVPIYKTGIAVLSWLMGGDAAGISAFERMPSDEVHRNFYLARFYAALGRYADAADAIDAIPLQHSILATASRLLRTAPAQQTPESLPILGSFGFVYLYVGATDRFLDFYEENLKTGYLCFSCSWLWHPSYAVVRRTKRFERFVNAAGLMNYWHERGFPDPDCYECEHNVAAA